MVLGLLAATTLSFFSIGEMPNEEISCALDIPVRAGSCEGESRFMVCGFIRIIYVAVDADEASAEIEMIQNCTFWLPLFIPEVEGEHQANCENKAELQMACKTAQRCRQKVPVLILQHKQKQLGVQKELQLASQEALPKPEKIPSNFVGFLMLFWLNVIKIDDKSGVFSLEALTSFTFPNRNFGIIDN